jgi:hypothetical protein
VQLANQQPFQNLLELVQRLIPIQRRLKDLPPILFFLAPFAQETFHFSALRNLFVQRAVFGLVVVLEDRFGIVLEDEHIFLCFDGSHQFELGP